MITIEGTFRLQTPLFVSEPSRWRISDDGQIKQGDNAPDTKPLNRTVRMPVLQYSAPSESDNVVAHNGNKVILPFFPSNDLRGRLRRLAADVVIDRLREIKQTISVDAYHGLTCGAISGTPSKSGLSLSEVEAARQHVWMGLFGGGPRILRSALRTHDMVPIIQATLDAGMVPARYADDAVAARSLADLTYIVHQIRVDNLVAFNDTKSGDIITDYCNAVQDWQDLIADEKELSKAAKEKARAAAEEAKKSRAEGRKVERQVIEKVKRGRLSSMTALEVIAPGTTFYVRIGFAEHITDAQVGLTLEALTRLVNAQNLGGLVSKGFGRFGSRLSLVEDGAVVTSVHNYNGGQYSLSDDPRVLRYMSALAEAIAAVDAADLERFFQDTADEAA